MRRHTESAIALGLYISGDRPFHGRRGLFRPELSEELHRDWHTAAVRPEFTVRHDWRQDKHRPERDDEVHVRVHPRARLISDGWHGRGAVIRGERGMHNDSGLGWAEGWSFADPHADADANANPYTSASDTDPCCPLRLRWICLHSECYGALPFWNVQSEMQLTSDSSTPSPRQWCDHLHGDPVSCTTTGRGALRLCRLDLRTECFWSLCVWDM